MNAEPEFLSANTIMSDDVVNPEGESLGKIENLVIDLEKGQVAYGVLSFGGFLGLGDKLFVIPWPALKFDPEHERFICHLSRELLEEMPGIERDAWEKYAPNRDRVEDVYNRYGYKLYW